MEMREIPCHYTGCFNMTQPTLYLDLDGVLADFLGGQYQITKMPWDTKFPNIEARNARNKRVFEAGAAFWERLQPMHDFYQLWNYVRPFQPHILTAIPHGTSTGSLSPASADYAREGKWEWVKMHMPGIPHEHFHCVLREHKQNYATKAEHGHVVSNILIDDMQANINEWNHNRGTGILHHNASDSISRLKSLGMVHA